MLPKAGYLPALTGLRAVAAGLVFFHHAELYVPRPNPYYIHEGSSGVSIFFVLSGYLITRMHKEKFRDGFGTFKDYWIRRAARILPLYYAVLLIKTVLAGELFTKSFGEWLSNLTLVQGYVWPSVWTGLNPVAWSLTVEESFYLLAPLLFWVFARTQLWPLILIGISVVFRWIVLSSPPYEGSYFLASSYLAGFTIFWVFPMLAIGMALAYWESSPSRRQRSAGFYDALFAFAVAVWLAFFLSSGWLRNAYGVSWVTETPYGQHILDSLGVVTALGIHAIAQGSRLAARLFGNKVMDYLGRISFAAYLLNTEFLYVGLYGTFVSLDAGLAGNVILFFCFFSLAAALLYELIEKPAHRWILARFGSRRGGEMKTPGAEALQA